MGVKPMSTQLHKIEDRTRDRTHTVIVKSELDNRTTRPLVERAIRLNVIIDDVLEHLNGYPEIEAEETSIQEHTLTTSEGDN